MPSGVNLMRSQLLYWDAQSDTKHIPSTKHSGLLLSLYCLSYHIIKCWSLVIQLSGQLILIIINMIVSIILVVVQSNMSKCAYARHDDMSRCAYACHLDMSTCMLAMTTVLVNVLD